MPTVSNTSPILNLAIIGRLDLIRLQFGQVLIPAAVVRELRIEENLPGSLDIRQAVGEKWIVTAEAEDRFLVKSLSRELDAGEAEAIALACQVRSSYLLLDEHEGRLVAKSMGLTITGTLGILLRADREGQILSLRREMENLRDQAGFRISDRLFSELLRRSETK